jgi:hypothetical protein
VNYNLHTTKNNDYPQFRSKLLLTSFIATIIAGHTLIRSVILFTIVQGRFYKRAAYGVQTKLRIVINFSYSVLGAEGVSSSKKRQAIPAFYVLMNPKKIVK